MSISSHLLLALSVSHLSNQFNHEICTLDVCASHIVFFIFYFSILSVECRCEVRPVPPVSATLD